MTYEDMCNQLHAHYMALDTTLDHICGEEFKANRVENQAKQDLLREAMRHINTAMREVFAAGKLIQGEMK
mgnify:FL=1